MKKGAQYVKRFDKRKQEDKSLCCEIFDVMVQFMIHTFFIQRLPVLIQSIFYNYHYLVLVSVIQCIKHPTHGKFGGFFFKETNGNNIICLKTGLRCATVVIHLKYLYLNSSYLHVYCLISCNSTICYSDRFQEIYCCFQIVQTI